MSGHGVTDLWVAGGGGSITVDTDELAVSATRLAGATTALDTLCAALGALEAAAMVDAARARLVNSVGSALAQVGSTVLAPHVVANLEERAARSAAVAAALDARIRACAHAALTVRQRVDAARGSLTWQIQRYEGAESAAAVGFVGQLMTTGSGLLVGTAPGWWDDPAAHGSFGHEPLGRHAARAALFLGDGSLEVGTERLVTGAAPVLRGLELVVATALCSPIGAITRIERASSGKGTAFPLGVAGGQLTYHGAPVHLRDMNSTQITALVTATLGQELRNTADSIHRLATQYTVPTPAEAGDKLADLALGLVPSPEDIGADARVVRAALDDLGHALADHARPLEARLAEAGGVTVDLATTLAVPRLTEALGGSAGAALGGAIGAGFGTVALPGGGTVSGAAVGSASGRALGGEYGTRVGEDLNARLDAAAQDAARARLRDPSVSGQERALLEGFLDGFRHDDEAGEATSFLGREGRLPWEPIAPAPLGSDVVTQSHGMVRILGVGGPGVPDDLAGMVREVGEVKPTVDDSDVGPVRIDTHEVASGTRAHVVYLPGTETFKDNWGGQPHDLGSDIEAVGGLRSAQMTETVHAMEQAGIAPGEEVHFVGHSGGALTAAAIAADPMLLARYDIASVLAAGGPVGGQDIPEGVRVLSLENRADPVVALDGAPLPPSPRHATISGLVDAPEGGWSAWEDSHMIGAYGRLADGAAEAEITAYRAHEEALAESLGLGDEATTVRSQYFVAQRVGR